MGAGDRVIVSSTMARCSLWGVGWSRTEGDYGMVVMKDTRSFGMSIGVPNGTSAGTCLVSVLSIVVSVELLVKILGRC